MTIGAARTTGTALAISLYIRDTIVDIYGDTQRQLNPRTCNNPAATDITQCTNASDPNGVYDENQGGGTTPDETSCTVQLECVDPVTGRNRCASSPYCNGTSWNASNLTRLDAQVRTSLGFDRYWPARANAVVQVGDNIDSANWAPSMSRADVCAPPVRPSVEVFTQVQNFVSRLERPLLEGGMPTLIAYGNHDDLGCWQRYVLPPLLAQSGFVASATDPNDGTATLYSVRANTPAGPLCFVHGIYNGAALNTLTAAEGLIGCGTTTIPTFVVSHYGDKNWFAAGGHAWWANKLSNTTTQVIDRNAPNNNVVASIWGHVTPGSLQVTRYDSANTNGAVDILSVMVNFQWMAFNGAGNSIFGGQPYVGVSAIDGAGGELVRMLISPQRNSITFVPYNPTAGKIGAWDYASTGYANINGVAINALSPSWCTRFGC